MAVNRDLEIWTIYDHPRDYPEHFVVRCWLSTSTGSYATNEVWLRPTLDEARWVILGNSPGAYRLERAVADDPCIVETWL